MAAQERPQTIPLPRRERRPLLVADRPPQDAVRVERVGEDLGGAVEGAERGAAREVRRLLGLGTEGACARAAAASASARRGKAPSSGRDKMGRV